MQYALPTALKAFADRRGEVRNGAATLVAAIWKQGTHVHPTVLDQVSRLPRAVRERVAALFSTEP